MVGEHKAVLLKKREEISKNYYSGYYYYTAFYDLAVFNILRTGALDSAQKADAIAVLGAAQYAGKPSPVFERD